MASRYSRLPKSYILNIVIKKYKPKLLRVTLSKDSSGV